jgi:hypothetical protein
MYAWVCLQGTAAGTPSMMQPYAAAAAQATFRMAGNMGAHFSSLLGPAAQVGWHEDRPPNSQA